MAANRLPSRPMDAGAKTRSRLLRRRYDEIVALHHHARQDDMSIVIVVATHDALPVEAMPNTDDGESVLACMPVAAARQWLHDAPGIDKWSTPAPDAMDVAVVAAGGVSIMRLTAR